MTCRPGGRASQSAFRRLPRGGRLRRGVRPERRDRKRASRNSRPAASGPPGSFARTSSSESGPCGGQRTGGRLNPLVRSNGSTVRAYGQFSTRDGAVGDGTTVPFWARRFQESAGWLQRCFRLVAGTMLHVRCVGVARHTADLHVLRSFRYTYKRHTRSLEPLEAPNWLNDAAVRCIILHVN